MRKSNAALLVMHKNLFAGYSGQNKTLGRYRGVNYDVCCPELLAGISYYQPRTNSLSEGRKNGAWQVSHISDH